MTALLKSDMSEARCVKSLMQRRWGIQHVNHSIAAVISMSTQRLVSHLTLMFCTHFLFMQSATSCGNSLSAIAINFGGLMNCINCSGIWVKVYYTACSNSRKLQM